MQEYKQLLEKYNKDENCTNEMFCKIISSIYDYITIKKMTFSITNIIHKNVDETVKEILGTLKIRPKSHWRRVDNLNSLKEDKKGRYYMIPFSYVYGNQTINDRLFVDVDNHNEVHYKRRNPNSLF